MHTLVAVQCPQSVTHIAQSVCCSFCRGGRTSCQRHAGGYGLGIGARTLVLHIVGAFSSCRLEVPQLRIALGSRCAYDDAASIDRHGEAGIRLVHQTVGSALHYADTDTVIVLHLYIRLVERIVSIIVIGSILVVVEILGHIVDCLQPGQRPCIIVPDLTACGVGHSEYRLHECQLLAEQRTLGGIIVGIHYIQHFGDGVVGIDNSNLQFAQGDGGGNVVGHGKCLLVGEAHEHIIGIVDDETYTTATLHRYGIARHRVGIVRRSRIAERCIVAHLGTYSGAAVECQRVALVAHDGFACGIVDEEHGDVLLVAPSLDLGNGGINIFLCHRIYGAGVVAHIAAVHHLEQSVGTEELREVITRGLAAFLVEVEQRCGTALVVLDDHRVLTQHLEEHGIELGVVAKNVIIEEHLVIHVSQCPDVVAEEVGPLSGVLCEHIAQCTVRTVDTRGALAIVPEHHVGEEVVGDLCEAAHIEQSLMLMTNLVCGTPVRTCIKGHTQHDAAQRTVVVSAVVPSAIHEAAATHAV